MAEYLAGLARKGRLGEQARTLCIVDVVADVGDAICQRHDASLWRHGTQMVGMAAHAVGHLARQVEAAPILLEPLHDADALLVVPKEALTLGAGDVDAAVACHGSTQPPLARVAKGRMAQVVSERYGLREVDVEGK